MCYADYDDDDDDGDDTLCKWARRTSPSPAESYKSTLNSSPFHIKFIPHLCQLTYAASSNFSNIEFALTARQDTTAMVWIRGNRWKWVVGG